MPKTTESQSVFVKVAECLYRNRSSGTYYALIKRNGKQIRKSLRTQDRKLAERQLKEFRERTQHLSAKAEERKTPFEAYADEWFAVHCVNLKPSSADRIRRCLKELNKTFRGLPLADISRRDCEAWMASRGNQTAASTFNKDAEVLKSIFEHAVSHGILLDNPAKIIKRRKVTDKSILIPSEDDFAKLLRGIANLDGKASEALHLVKLLAYSGMRLGEATNIVWGEVDFENGRFTVSGGEGGTKNHEIRIVPLFPKMTDFLADLKAEREPGKTDRIIRIDSAKKALISACRNEALPHFTHHCLRHYFVSNAIEKGVDFKTIAAWVGHKDGGLLVAKTYGHLRDTHSFEMAKRM